MNKSLQSWDPLDYAATAPFNVSEAGRILQLLNAQPGERILDLGCGDGTLTRRLMEARCNVVGIDPSVPQVSAAQEKGIDARVGDGHDLPFDDEFDAVFSIATLHWLRDPDAAIASMARALRIGGRLVAEFGGHGCVAAIRTALHTALRKRQVDPLELDPWYFPSEEEYIERLTNHGFHIEHSELQARPTPLPTGIHGWLSTFSKPFLTPLPEDEREAFIEEVAQVLRPILFDSRKGFIADYVRLRIVARRIA